MEAGTLSKVEEFKQEAGEATGPMPERVAPDPEPEFDEELVVSGTSDQLSFDVGGKPPTSSKLRVIGKAIDVRGQFKKGQLIEARIVLKVGGISHDDKEDSSTGQIVDCVKTHKARIVSFERAE